jgi:hypothetical protein
LGQGVKGLGNVSGVTLIHVIVEGPRVSLSTDVRGGVGDDPPLTLAEKETYGGQKEPIDETPDPTWEDEDEVVVAARNNLGKDGGTMVGDASMVVIQISRREV